MFIQRKKSAKMLQEKQFIYRNKIKEQMEATNS